MKQEEHKTISVIIPTRNGASTLGALFAMLVRQSVPLLEVLVVDSSSEDASVTIAKENGAQVTVINAADFDHGGTRAMIARRAKGKILVFLTQDAVPVDEDAVAKLIEPLSEEKKVAVSYGRQLPAADATPFAAHLRFFNYPPDSRVRALADREHLGLKTAFVSNSFAAYLKNPLEEVGFFKSDLVFGEDTSCVGSLLLRGWKIAYVAEAAVYHSHNYSWLQEFRRSFDIGVLHATEKWLIDSFGRAEGHGVDYLRSEFEYLKKLRRWGLLPSYVIRNGLKFLGYQLGRNFTIVPESLLAHLSMNKQWWHKRENADKAS